MLILDIEYRISTRLILDIQNFFKKIIFNFEFEWLLWLIFTSEYRISTRLRLDTQNFFKKIIFGFEFECYSSRFSHLNIEYPPD